MEVEKAPQRQYREKVEPETPSHPGGVNEARREHIRERTKFNHNSREKGDMRPPDSRSESSAKRSDGPAYTDHGGRDRDVRRGGDASSHQRKRRSRSRSRSSERNRVKKSDGHSSRSDSRGSESDGRHHSKDNMKVSEHHRHDERRSNEGDGNYSRCSKEVTRNHHQHESSRSRDTITSSVRTDSSTSSSRITRTPSHTSQTPTRGGIGINENEWEEPERLCTSSNAYGVASGTPLVGGRTPMTPMTDGDFSRGSLTATPLSMSGRGGLIKSGGTGSKGKQIAVGEWDKATPLRGGFIGSGTPSREALVSEEEVNCDEILPSNTPRTALSRRAMQRAGFLVQDTPMLGENDNGDGALPRNKDGKRSKYYDPDEEDDEFDRDFYLSEEGPTFDSNGDNKGAFIGSAVKFKEREDQMAKSRAKGEGKMAGMSARKSQLHVDQAAWEDNRMLQSGYVRIKKLIR